MNFKQLPSFLLIFLKPILEQLFLPLYKLHKKPHSLGYNIFKWRFIEKVINNEDILSLFNSGKIPANYGLRLDERVVEYPWIFANLAKSSKKILDAGSTFNFKPIIQHDYFKNKTLDIYTFYPEKHNFPSDKVFYSYGDLRKMPFNDGQFDQIISHSTIEHINMDNSIYGYKTSHKTEQKDYEYMMAIEEMTRVLCSGGQLLLTFPFGKFENQGFFQQFDSEMLSKIVEYLNKFGKVDTSFIRYTTQGWIFATEDSCKDIISFNPHTGSGRGSDGAAHCRSICLLKFLKE